MIKFKVGGLTMTSVLFISDFTIEVKEVISIIHKLKNQGIKTEMTSPKHFHLDVLFDHQFGHPTVRNFKQQMATSKQVYIIFPYWNKPLLWGMNALFGFLTKDELEGKCIVPIVITETKSNQNEAYKNFSSVFKDYMSEICPNWVFIQHTL